MDDNMEAMDIAGETAARSMVGMDFRKLIAKMESKGYKAGKMINSRDKSTATVYLVNGRHETMMRYKVTFEWNETYPGVKEPGKVLSSSWTKPLRPEPFEMR